MKYCQKVGLFLINILIISSLQGQVKLTDQSFRYFTGGHEPDSAWNSIDYNDSLWEIGTSSIGYGDGDDATVIDTVITVYLRYNFVITNMHELNDLCLYIDFDDAFVAYLNGTEITRVNLGKHGKPTYYQQLADRSHEAENYRHLYSTVQGYYLDNSFVSRNMKIGKNVLAVEVHNDSVKGSDLSFSCELMNTFGEYNMYNPYHRYKKSIELDSTLLPIIQIESGEMGIPVKRIEVPARMVVIMNDQGLYNKPTDHNIDFEGSIVIEVRGESSADFPKRSYDIEIGDKSGNDTSVSLLGLPKESDWILSGPFADKSQIRNAMIYELARKTGHWAPRTVFCELVLNGEYLGLYNLVEKIKRDDNRINISKLDSNDIEGIQVTGGYIIKYDKGNSGIQIVYPKEKNLHTNQYNYIVSFFNRYNLTLNSKHLLDPDNGYKTMIDDMSLIDYMIIAELAKNCDSYLYSSYMYKDRDDIDGRLKFGPLWDFDLCFGNAIWQQGNRTYGWQFEYPDNNRFYITKLFIDTVLVNLFEERWFLLRKSFLHTDSLNIMIDRLSTSLKGPIERNYTIWPVINKDIFWPAYQVQSYYHEILYIKNWIEARTQWIDNNISKILYNNPYLTFDESGLFIERQDIQVYPNPFTDYIVMELDIKAGSMISASLISINGKIEKLTEPVYLNPGYYKIVWQTDRMLLNGLYILEVEINVEEIRHYKLLKSN